MDIKKVLEKQTKEDKEHLIRIETCSARDCTGLIASKPQNKHQVDAYDEIYSYNPEHYYDEEKMKKGRK